MVHVFISGYVQGIGFRQYLRSQANKLNIKGWVKNSPDSRVEAIFTGESESLQKMLEICKKGPFLAEVKSLEIEELPDQKFDSFDIIKE